MACEMKENRGRARENRGINRAFKTIKSENVPARKPQSNHHSFPKFKAQKDAYLSINTFGKENQRVER